jgi:RNA polymerase sigma-70 factor (ECF subfamily)
MRDSPTSEPDPALESSVALVARAQHGDEDAINQLAARWLPRLKRWATGRLPQWARDLVDTHDVVQETVFQAFKRIEGFEVRGEGALQAYLRQAVLNRIRMEIRRVGRRPEHGLLDSRAESLEPSPLELAVGRELLDQYESALAALSPEDREAIIGRIEMGLTHEDLAVALGKPTANAARMAVERALVRLARAMGR